MGHRVPNHKNKCRNPHGHRYRLEVTIKGEINTTKGDSSEGMVFDFGDLKELMMQKIHNSLDHCFMIYEDDQELIKAFANWAPVVVPFIPTAENIVQWCFDQLKTSVPRHIAITKLTLYETPHSWAQLCPRHH